MATNKDLIKKIKDIDPNAEISDMNNADLVTELSALRKEDAESLDISVSDVEVIVAPYSVAEGKSITSKKGILTHGDEVKVEYLGGGKQALDALVESEHVIRT